jgi:micrococcal nuclease
MNVLLTVLLFFVLSLSAFAYDDIIGVQYVRCHDGDTCTVNIDHLPDIFGARLSIRLAGLDTPELHGKCAKETHLALQAKRFTTSMLSNAKVIGLTDIHRDKYFRVLATVMADGVDVNHTLILKGYARLYDGGTKRGWC